MPPDPGEKCELNLFLIADQGATTCCRRARGFCVTLSAAKEISRKTGMMNLCMPERVSGGDAKFQGPTADEKNGGDSRGYVRMCAATMGYRMVQRQVSGPGSA